MYSSAAQYNEPPTYPVTRVCNGIDKAPKGTDILGRIFAGVVSYKGNRSCYDTLQYAQPTETNVGWHWQVSSYTPILNSSDLLFPFFLKSF